MRSLDPLEVRSFEWGSASPASQGMDAAKLQALQDSLARRRTAALLVIRRDQIVWEWYAPEHGPEKPHYTASLAKALVGGVSLMTAMEDGRIGSDDLAARYIPAWRSDPLKSRITIRHLATHCSGLEDAEQNGLPHDQLPGWKGAFWRREPDPFTIARDQAPVQFEPGTRSAYSNPGMAMLAYAVTAALHAAPQPEIRALLRERIMRPIGVPDAEWSVGYGTTYEVDGLKLVANWGGGSYTARAAARVGRLMLRKGDWEGQQLLSPSVVEAATTYAGMPNASGLGWWVNRGTDGRRRWKAAPDDAFWGSGAGQQFLLVVPSRNLIVVRSGQVMDDTLSHDEGLAYHLVTPLMEALASPSAPPYPPSPVIRGITWAPPSQIVRKAWDSDNWPLTWADDEDVYTAYGDGRGFEPNVPEKLSLGFARVRGGPEEFQGINIRSATGERKGNGPHGKKASGLLMVDGVLYMWVRNAGNAQLAWSEDHAQSWSWCDWKLTTSFGCPTFLNFGRDYAGARDAFVYVYSQDADDAYTPADRMVMARVPRDRIRDRGAYEFFQGLDATKDPVWTRDIHQRGAVFTNPGRCYRGGISYNSGLRRYLWCQILPGPDPRFQGGFGIFDAPEPWGPWTTAYFTVAWDVGPGETSSFPTKWMSADGQRLHLVFSGDDYFAVRKARLVG